MVKVPVAYPPRCVLTAKSTSEYGRMAARNFSRLSVSAGRSGSCSSTEQTCPPPPMFLAYFQGEEGLEFPSGRKKTQGSQSQSHLCGSLCISCVRLPPPIERFATWYCTCRGYAVRGKRLATQTRPFYISPDIGYKIPTYIREGASNPVEVSPGFSLKHIPYVLHSMKNVAEKQKPLALFFRNFYLFSFLVVSSV